ncbi:hypothetical protein [Mesorhizobium sp. ZC-5]|uniref:hypothetical protein n=1 Tax=Mesorhizobium sp. ZC-5 TaxID=2986066 RepID=UPI0021E88E7E|nr:hypothetical protein [Mesorhizobium sp. ZC-5]MCV3239670.1 hypothetical protein [Mesorhizobium sp. ZC-5]
MTGSPNFIAAVDRNAYEEYRLYVTEHEGLDVFRIEHWRKRGGDFAYASTALQIRAAKLRGFENAVIKATETARAKGLCK